MHQFADLKLDINIQIELTYHSEKKIDRIEDRLAGIENVLAALASRLGNLDLQKESHD